MKSTLAFAALGVALLAAPASAENINLKVLGQPLATGLIQKNVEQPFFEGLAAKTGLPITVDYKPVDVTGIKDYEELRVLKSGLFDLVSLRMSQVSRDEPAILGFDLVGLNPDYDSARKVVAAWEGYVDKKLQEKFNTKLIGVWPFGPQVLFCKPEIKKLADVKGHKVRVYDQNLAKFVESVGGVPVPIGFSEVHQSLARGVVDCANHRPELGQLRRLAGSDPVLPADRLPDRHQRLCGQPGYLEQVLGRSAEDPAGRHRRTDRKGVDLFERTVRRRGSLQCRQGSLHHRQEIRHGRSSGHRGRRRPVEELGPEHLVSDLGRGLRQAGRRLLGGMEEARRPAGRHAVRLGRPRVPIANWRAANRDVGRIALDSPQSARRRHRFLLDVIR